MLYLASRLCVFLMRLSSHCGWVQSLLSWCRHICRKFEILIQIQSMCSMFSCITQVSVCWHQMASCKQSSLSERYDALTLPDCNMGETLRVQAVPAGCDAASILCHKHDSGHVGLWFMMVQIFGGDLLLTADVQKTTRTCQSLKKDGKLEPVHVLARSDTQAHIPLLATPSQTARQCSSSSTTSVKVCAKSARAMALACTSNAPPSYSYDDYNQVQLDYSCVQ